MKNALYIKWDIILIGFVFVSNYSFGHHIHQRNDSVEYNIIKVGTGFPAYMSKFNKYIIDIEYERGIKKLNRLTFAIYYHYIKGKYGYRITNPGTTPTSIFSPRNDHLFMLNAKIYPFLFKSESMSLIYIQGGLMYLFTKVRESTVRNGPGFTFGGGVQLRVYKSFCVDLYYFKALFADYGPNYIDKKFYSFGDYYGIKLGYKF